MTGIALKKKSNFRAILERGAISTDGAVRQSAPRIEVDDLSPDQRRAYDAILTWLRTDPLKRKQCLRFGGLAGTGKTTLVTLLARIFADKYTVVFAAFTGKAVSVLRSKLTAAGVQVPCMTLHSLLYRPVVDEKTGDITGWELKPDLTIPSPEDPDWRQEVQFVVVDEASMVDSKLFQDLSSFGVPILAVGDHGQLPPIGKDMSNLMERPDVKLETIHRQAQDSPIITLAHHVRKGGNPFAFDAVRSGAINVISGRIPAALAATAVNSKGIDDVGILCYRNATRVSYNNLVRTAAGIEGPAPADGEKLICLNNHKALVFNGMRGFFSEGNLNLDRYYCIQGRVTFPAEGFWLQGRLQFGQFCRERTFGGMEDLNKAFRGVQVDGADVPRFYRWDQAGLLFDYGYAMTVHKSQGSQFKHAIVRLERPRAATQAEYNCWLYTAITRAADKLTLVR